MKIEKFKVSIIDNDILFGSLLKSDFEHQEEVEFENIFQDEKEFLNELRSGQLNVDVVIMELRLKSIPINEFMTVIKSEFPKLKVVILTSLYKESYIGSLFKMGVDAFLPKSISLSELKAAILEVRFNNFFITPEQFEIMKEQVSQKAPKPICNETDRLTERELEVLDLICQQNTTGSIADKLFITKRTVEGHRSNLLLKTGTKNTVGLVIWAMQNKIVDLDSYLVGINN
ncbi:response regulator transcription factor [Prolixibacteraceae bacterium JC049]|nr:response regulator transcription factor [Prolixibacteraceae bacterium JC049]